MRNLAIKLASILSTFFLAGSVLAAPITYDVSRTFGHSERSSLTGTITTDGTIGTLTAANVLDWSLLLQVGGIGGRAALLLPGLNPAGAAVSTSSVNGTSSFSASANFLTVDVGEVFRMDYSATDGTVGFYRLFEHYEDGQLISTYDASARSGVQVLATAQNVPAPAGIIILLVGVAFVVLGRRTR